MKRLSLLFALLPSATLAHPEGHGGFDYGAGVVHVMTAPDHLALLVAVLVGGAVLRHVWKARRP
ncbi:MAG: hypothetical protein WCC57_17210 [Paracoccaceae bacterium]